MCGDQVETLTVLCRVGDQRRSIAAAENLNAFARYNMK